MMEYKLIHTTLRTLLTRWFGLQQPQKPIEHSPAQAISEKKKRYNHGQYLMMKTG